MDLIFVQYKWIFLIVALWTIPWKGVALWRSARNGKMGWFIVLLIANTLGILEIVYIFFFSRKKPLMQNQEMSVPTIKNKRLLV